jgi:four helix bundle protein
VGVGDSGHRFRGEHVSFCRMAPFRLLEIARAVADEINGLLGNRKLRLIHRGQLRDSAQSIAANVREGMGRKPGPHRNQSYRDARGSAEETDEHLRANFADGRVPVAAYRRLHNRLALIVDIVNTIVD